MTTHSTQDARAAHPGGGRQALHTDWHAPAGPGAYQVCNSIWLLDDFTPDNGATRLVPGSHRIGSLPTGSDHPHETLLIAPAGTVVFFNSHLWHGGGANRTDRPRRAVHAYFGRRRLSQQTDQRSFLQPETRRRLSEPARYILDVA